MTRPERMWGYVLALTLVLYTLAIAGLCAMSWTWIPWYGAAILSLICVPALAFLFAGTAKVIRVLLEDAHD